MKKKRLRRVDVSLRVWQSRLDRVAQQLRGVEG